MTETILFGILVIGAYLEFGACDLVLIIFAMPYALCPKLLSTESVLCCPHQSHGSCHHCISTRSSVDEFQ